jgi:hypothetical protein
MKLRTRISLTAVTTAATLGTTGAFLLPAASAHPLTHRLTFASVQQSSVNFSSTAGAQQDKDVNQAGKVIGYDELRFTFDPQAKTGSIEVAVDLSGGFLYGSLCQGDGPVAHGRVTGGTGVFQGATGSITATQLDQNDDRTDVTITYHT